jgi:serine/threonine-protein kinase RsbW
VNPVKNVLRIAADVGQLAAVREFVREQAARGGAGGRVVADMVQAVDESVTNTILHGYRGAAGSIQVEVDVADRSLIVRLRDQAPAFDPTRVPSADVTLPLDRRPLGGMGIHLCRELTDEQTYTRTEDGNELTLLKSIDEPEGGAKC